MKRRHLNWTMDCQDGCSGNLFHIGGLFLLCIFFIAVGCSDQPSATSKSSPTASSTIAGQSNGPLEGLSFNGSNDSLKTIQNAALPAARSGNLIAVNICRQTMYALGEITTLKSLPYDSVKPLARKVANSWFSMVEKRAESGDAFFKTVLAVIYLEGHGVGKNPEKALKLLAEAADAGYADALCKLGNVYNVSNVVNSDFQKAKKYYQQAGKKGSSIALYHLGTFYFHGKGAPKDRKKAVRFYRESAELNNPWAQRDLGYCYRDGYGVEKDRDEAIRWFRLAAENGDYTAGGSLAILEESAPDAMKGLYHDIISCDLETLASKLDLDSSLLQTENAIGWTPLTLAVSSGCKDRMNTIKYLINKGADSNEKHRKYNFTPLHLAVFIGRKDIVEYLTAKGADLNSFKGSSPFTHPAYKRMRNTPLHTAFYNAKYDLVDWLLQKGADYNQKNEDGRTLFEFAVGLNERERITQICERQGLPVPKMPFSVEELLSAINDCNATSTKQHGQQRVKAILASHSKLAHESDANGTTPLHHAAFYHMNDLIEQLVALGADVNARNKQGSTPLHKITDDKNIARFLISQGARVNERNNKGQTPLHRIVSYADVDNARDVVTVLLANGASKSIRDIYGKTPFNIAESKGFKRLAEALR